MTARFAPALLVLALAACSAPQQDAASTTTTPAATTTPAQPAAATGTALSAQALSAYHWNLTGAVDVLPRHLRRRRAAVGGGRRLEAERLGGAGVQRELVTGEHRARDRVVGDRHTGDRERRLERDAPAAAGCEAAEPCDGEAERKDVERLGQEALPGFSGGSP